MSTARVARLSALALVVFGGAATVIQLTGTFDFREGSLWLPVSVVVGILTLIANRPRTNRKDATNGT